MMSRLNIEKITTPREAYNFVSMIYPNFAKELAEIQEKAVEDSCEELVRDLLLGAVHYWMSPEEENEDEE